MWCCGTNSPASDISRRLNRAALRPHLGIAEESVSSNPVVPNVFRNEPFGDNLEGLSCFHPRCLSRVTPSSICAQPAWGIFRHSSKSFVAKGSFAVQSVNRHPRKSIRRQAPRPSIVSPPGRAPDSFPWCSKPAPAPGTAPATGPKPSGRSIESAVRKVSRLPAESIFHAATITSQAGSPTPRQPKSMTGVESIALGKQVARRGLRRIQNVLAPRRERLEAASHTAVTASVLMAEPSRGDR